MSTARALYTTQPTRELSVVLEWVTPLADLGTNLELELARPSLRSYSISVWIVIQFGGDRPSSRSWVQVN
jgi:hypothetical protein